MRLYLPDLPPSRRPPRLALLHCLLFSEAPVSEAAPAAQEALPRAASDRGLPAGHQPCHSPALHLQLVQQRCIITARLAGDDSYLLIHGHNLFDPEMFGCEVTEN